MSLMMLRRPREVGPHLPWGVFVLGMLSRLFVTWYSERE
jgi:hypothetical protein